MCLLRDPLYVCVLRGPSVCVSTEGPSVCVRTGGALCMCARCVLSSLFIDLVSSYVNIIC